jgi:hypothetical protein
VGPMGTQLGSYVPHNVCVTSTNCAVLLQPLCCLENAATVASQVQGQFVLLKENTKPPFSQRASLLVVLRDPPCCIPVRMKDSLVGVVGPPCVVVDVTQRAGVVPKTLVHFVPSPVTLKEGAAGGARGGGSGEDRGMASAWVKEQAQGGGAVMAGIRQPVCRPYRGREGGPLF